MPNVVAVEKRLPAGRELVAGEEADCQPQRLELADVGLQLEALALIAERIDVAAEALRRERLVAAGTPAAARDKQPE